MHLVSSNIKYLRKQKGWTQQDLADQLEVKRPLIGSYEEGRADPRLNTLLRISELFEVSADELLSLDLSTNKSIKKKPAKILAITVDMEDRENIELVPQKAAAGYTNGYADTEYIQELPKFRLPMLPNNGTYRAFEISGDSMLPLLPGTIIIGQYVEQVEDIRNGQTYIIVSKQEGVVYKRVFNYVAEKGLLFLVSDNTVYSPYEIPADSVMEIWEAKAFISMQFPEGNSRNKSRLSMEELTQMVLDIKEDITKLKH
ncbi:MAG: transcriptional regulator with XRE-family HTH domain [Marivirga sp.]